MDADFQLPGSNCRQGLLYSLRLASAKMPPCCAAPAAMECDCAMLVLLCAGRTETPVEGVNQTLSEHLYSALAALSVALCAYRG